MDTVTTKNWCLFFRRNWVSLPRPRGFEAAERSEILAFNVYECEFRRKKWRILSTFM